MTVSATYWLKPQNPLAALGQSYVARRVCKLASYCALACLLGILALVATATAPALFGYHTYVVNGGSMEPALKRGSVAIAAATSSRVLQVGDIIAYRQSPQNPPVLHRIVQITNDNGQLAFVTQGDQNQTPDSVPVSLQGPGDKVTYMVPYAGYVLGFAHGTLGRVLLIGLPAITLLALFFIPGKKRPAESIPSVETEAVGAERSAVWEQRPSLEAQALQRGLLSPQRQTAAPSRQPRPSVAAQALHQGLLSSTTRSVTPIRAKRPSLETQALRSGVLLVANPASGNAGPARHSRAA